MGNHSPSRYRREGRNAYSHGTSPDNVCPYKIDRQSWQRDNWFEGWEEATKAYTPPVVDDKRELLADAIAERFPAILAQYSQYKIADFVLEFME